MLNDEGSISLMPIKGNRLIDGTQVPTPPGIYLRLPAKKEKDLPIGQILVKGLVVSAIR